ncbi:MAG: microcystin-dependent protein [Ilumatobacter sp.]|jgi:microcystin-dependent protein
MDPFIGEIRIFPAGGYYAPRGWAFCDGQLLSISQNWALFSLIGAIYGGDSQTTMALPNLQGRAPMHPGQGPGLTSRGLGESIGVEIVTLTEAQMPAHTHVLRAAGQSARSELPSATVALGEAGETTYAPPTAPTVNMAAAAAVTRGGGQAHTNLQPFLVMNFIIALAGIYPQRP